MHPPQRIAVLLVVSTIAVLLLSGNLVEGKKKSKKKGPPPGESEGKGICASVTCTKAPEGLACTRTYIKNPSLLKRLGKLKDCCSAWRCQDVDGSYSTYFGMSGDATPESFTGEAEQYKDGKGGKNDKCMEAKAVCPKPDGADKCLESNTPEAKEFKPKGDLDSCCPTYNCTKSDGSYHVHFAMTGGTMPKASDTAGVAKQKGEAKGDKKCPNMICAPKPASPEDGPVCSASTTDDSSRIKALGPFRECCDVWKCSYDDGSYYIHFELQAPSFWVADTSFYSELPEVPDEGVTIVRDESDEDEPEPTTAMTTTTTSTPAPVLGSDESEESEEVTTTTTQAPKAFKPKRHHKKRRKHGKAIPVASQSQVVTVIVTNGGNKTMQSGWNAGYDAAMTAGGGVPPPPNPHGKPQTPVVRPSSNPNLQSQVPPQQNPQQQSEVQFQESEVQPEQFQPPPQQTPGGGNGQMQSMQSMQLRQMQQMQNMNMQNMQNMQNMNNAQMQMMMAQQNSQMGGGGVPMGPPNGVPMGPPMY